MKLPSTKSSLDHLRHYYGQEKLKLYYKNLVYENPEQAVRMINHENLHFATLFTLREEIVSNRLNPSMNARNLLALELIHEVISKEKILSEAHTLSLNNIQMLNSVLKWILETGSRDDGLCSEMDEVLDIASLLLARIYRDHSTLPTIAELIFERNIKRTYNLDLIWAYFECRHPQGLVVIAGKLLSENPCDVKMASKLLEFIPGMDSSNQTSPEKKYMNFIHWYKENNLYLKYTGESYHHTNHPIPYCVVKEAKYLCKTVCIDTGSILTPLTKDEASLLQEFRTLDVSAQEALSSFSYMLHNKNLASWRGWIKSPLSRQMKLARIGGGYD